MEYRDSPGAFLQLFPLGFRSRLTESYLGFRRQKARRDTHLLLSVMETVTPPSFDAKSAEVLQATSNHLVIAKRLVGSYRSGGNAKLAKSGSE